MPRADGRHVITVTKECYDVVMIARELANVLNSDASNAIPELKAGRWTLSDVISLASIDWIIAAKKKHNSILHGRSWMTMKTSWT